MLIFDKHFSNSIAMKQQEVFNKIGGIIKELNDQYQYLQNTPGSLNDLELEFFIANTHFLTHNIELLRKLTLQNNLTKPEEPSQQVNKEKFFEPLVQLPKSATEKTATPADETDIAADKNHANLNGNALNDQPAPQIDLTTESAGDDYSYIRKEPEIIRHELEVDESWIAEEEGELLNKSEKTDNPVTIPQPGDNLTDKPQILKQDKEETLTINQKISAQLANKESAELTVLPISDLKSATTLNDKLLYVKDLFNGYSLAYSEAIEILNRFNTFEEADHFLKTNYYTKHHWEDKPETTAKFYELLKRRYA